MPHPNYPENPDPRILAEIEERLRATKIELEQERARANRLNAQVNELRSECISRFIADQQRRRSNIFRRIADSVISSVIVAAFTLVAIKESLQMKIWQLCERSVDRFVMLDKPISTRGDDTCATANVTSGRRT